MNVVNLVGRLGRDPETTYSQSGMAICKVALATSKKIKGEQVTQWHRLTAFQKTAELIQQYCYKGDQLAVEGELSYGSYDKDGAKHYTTDIIVNRMHFISSGTGGGQQSGGQGGYQPSQQPGGYSPQGVGGQQQQHRQQSQQQQNYTPSPEDDIPF